MLPKQRTIIFFKIFCFTLHIKTWNFFFNFPRPRAILYIEFTSNLPPRNFPILRWEYWLEYRQKYFQTPTWVYTHQRLPQSFLNSSRKLLPQSFRRYWKQTLLASTCFIKGSTLAVGLFPRKSTMTQERFHSLEEVWRHFRLKLSPGLHSSFKMAIFSVYILNRAGGLIYHYDHFTPKSEVEKTFSYPLDIMLREDDKLVVIFGERDGIKGNDFFLHLVSLFLNHC